MAPQLTVGLIVHNDPEGLVRSAACVLNQSWAGATALKVVDDGSTDDTPTVLARLEERYDAVVVIRNEHRVGLAHARNQIMRSTESRYLAWIDAGDLWHPRKLDLQFQALNEAPWRGFAASPFPEALEYGFTALLGESEVYRRVGELDEQLTYLAGEDFLIRLALSGVPITTPAIDDSLWTVRTNQQERAWRPLAADANVVWRKHRAAMHEQFGWRAAADYRRRQLVAVADAASLRGSRLQTSRCRAMAGSIRLVTKTTWRSLIDAGVRGPMGRGARAAGRLLFHSGARLITAHRLKPTSRVILSIVNRMEGPRFGRLMAVAPTFAAFTSPGPAARSAIGNGPLALSVAERAVLTVAYASLAAKKLDRAVGVLEAHIAEQHSRVHPRIFERLADVQRRADRLDCAKDALQRGLRAHPSNDGLHLALAEIFVRMSNWEAAAAHWERVSDELKATANVWTSVGIARAYRLTGSPREADAVARRAAALHPRNDQLELEIDLCRPFHVEWSRCLVTAGTATGDNSSAVGAVETLGFLAGDAEPLVGNITSSDTAYPEVHLCINNLPVASTLAASASGPHDGKAFSINCADLLEYLGDGDVIQVIAEGKPVTLPGLGPAAMVHGGLPSRFDVLENKVRQGYVFTKFGRLRPGHTDESKRATLDFYAEVSRLIESSTGLTVFPFYGTLLGAVRENDFIAHDVGGFDMVVICQGRQPPEVKAEFAEICQLLLERGYHLTLEPWCVLIRRQHADTILLDLSYAWFNSADEFNISFGWRFKPIRGQKRVRAHRVCRLASRGIRVPGNAERVLEQLYGPKWQVPDQGYPVQYCLKRDTRYLLNEAEMRGLLE